MTYQTCFGFSFWFPQARPYASASAPKWSTKDLVSVLSDVQGSARTIVVLYALGLHCHVAGYTDAFVEQVGSPFAVTCLMKLWHVSDFRVLPLFTDTYIYIGTC